MSARWICPEPTVIGGGFAGNGLEVVIPEGGFRGLGPMNRLEPAPREAWYRYHVRLLHWNAAFKGKLPGLAGLYSSSGRGCIPPTESSPGWSARGLFGRPGTEGAPAGQDPDRHLPLSRRPGRAHVATTSGGRVPLSDQGDGTASRATFG